MVENLCDSRDVSLYDDKHTIVYSQQAQLNQDRLKGTMLLSFAVARIEVRFARK